MSAAKKDNDHDLSDWGQWANHVLAELKRLNDSIEELRKDLTDSEQGGSTSLEWRGIATRSKKFEGNPSNFVV